MNRGYVKVWRKIEDSGLMQMPNTLAVFLHILFNATHKDRKVGTHSGVIELKRGQYISGRIQLAKSLKQSEQMIRTSLSKLEKLGILTTTSTNKYSVYTIENYNKYQDEQQTDNQQNNQQSTNNQPTNNQQSTTKQECNNLNIEECNKNTEKPITPIATLTALGITKKSAQTWLKIRKEKKLTFTEEALEIFKAETIKAGISLQDAITYCNGKSWGGFKASWYENDRNVSNNVVNIYQQKQDQLQEFNRKNNAKLKERLFGTEEKDITNATTTVG